MALNKVMLIGNLGADPETRYTPQNKAVTNLRLATTHKSKDNEYTEWHRVTLWGRTAEIAAEYLRKGSKVYIEGRLQTRKWQAQDGTDRYTTEVVAHDMQMLGGSGAPRATEKPKADAPATTGDFDDDVPF